MLWSRIPKLNFVGVHTLQFGAYDAVITFNEGNQARLNVLSEIGVRVGNNCVNILRYVDGDRIQKADKAITEETKQARKRSRMTKKNLLDKEKEKKSRLWSWNVSKCKLSISFNLFSCFL